VWQGDRFLPFRVEKRVQMAGGSTDLAVCYVLTNTSPAVISARFGVESNWGILGGNGPGAYLALPDQPRAALDSTGEAEAVEALRLVSEELSMEIGMGYSRPATLWRFPIEAISNSEAGFERGYQSTCLLPWWEIRLPPGGTWQVRLEFALRQRGA
jgi:alpha-amylase